MTTWDLNGDLNWDDLNWDLTRDRRPKRDKCASATDTILRRRLGWRAYTGHTMSESSEARIVSVTASEAEDVRLPADAAAALGPDATMTLGPGQVVILRPGGQARKRGARTMAEVIATSGARPVDDVSVLRPSTTPLSEDERAALRDFLSEE
jgi:hypothetical protein